MSYKISTPFQAADYVWTVCYNDAQGNCRLKHFTSEEGARNFASALPPIADPDVYRDDR